MKSDLDRLMKACEAAAILVTGAGMHNPAMVYLTGGGHMTSADLICKIGHKGFLFHYPMERDEAARSNLEIRSYSNYSYTELLKEANGDRKLAMALRYQKMFQDAGVTSGRVLLYGLIELGSGYAIFSLLQGLLPDIQFIGIQDEDVLLTAMATKDADEIERIKQMGKITARVVENTADYLSTRPVRAGKLLNPQGEWLTIADVKSRINLWLAEAGAENPEGTIFAIGHDAGVPHSSGKPDDVLQLGETIVFDIYPCEAGGGYFYDMTRTWCLGYATEQAQELYQDVLQVYRTIVEELKVDMPFKHYQQRTCELFEAMGHSNVLTEPTTEVGYVHSLGHGVGLHIHERPFSGLSASDGDRLAVGSVFTIEPGLYYPEKNLGVRLEDTYCITTTGQFEKLAEFPLDLVIPIKGEPAR